LDAFVGGDPAAPDVTVANPDNHGVKGIIVGAVQSYTLTETVLDMGGDPDALERALSEAYPVFDSPTPSESERFGPEYAVSMVALMVLLFALINGGAMIAMSIVEEKSSRVVEILLSTIKPTQLLAGKMLGVATYGLSLVIIIGGALIAAVTGIGLVDEIPISLGWTFAFIVVWFLLGYAIFALLFGAFASLISRYEEIGAVTTPLTFLILIPFYVAIYLVPFQPDSTLVRGLSQIPLLSPFMMPIRNALGSVAWWEMATSILIVLITIPGLVWLAARLYQRGVLHTGGRLKLSDALRRSKSN
jgi:ABC-2 type transport system permease protein